MANISPEIETFARIKVIGVGGSGKNAVNHMVNSKVRGVDFIAVNTDAQDLHYSMAKKKIHIGKNLTRGLGTGMNPELGKRAIEETREEVQEAIKGADMVFITGGLGGGTGSGASPTVARISKELGALTVAVVTKPFFFEGRRRMQVAEQALEELKKEVDAIIVIQNDRLLKIIDKNTTAKNAFVMCDEILRQAVEGISDLITTPGMINIDFADIRAVMENAGSALMGIGSATGENRATEAAKQAINSPLLDLSIQGAKGVLFSIAGGEDLTMFEIQDAAKVITESIDSQAKVIYGNVISDKLKKNEVRITVIASGFPDDGQPGNSDNKSIPLFDIKSGGGSDNRNLSSSSSSEQSIPIRTEKNETEERKSRFFQSSVNTPQKEVKIEEKKDIPKEDDDDDWGTVPAFLRRSKIK